MSPDSQRFEIDHLRHKVSDWHTQQCDFRTRLGLITEMWLEPALITLGMSADDCLAAIGRKPEAQQLRNLLTEEALRWYHDDETLLGRYGQGPGNRDNGLCLRYLRRLSYSQPSLWRVGTTESGFSIDIAPCGGGQTITVHDRTQAAMLEKHDVLVTRVIDMPAGPMLGEGVIVFNQVPHGALSDAPEDVAELLCQSVVELLQPRPRRSRARARGGAGVDGAGRGGRKSTASGSEYAGGSGSEDSVGEPGRGDKPQAQSASPDKAERERLLDRVRKLFAMAQQGEASPHEAEIALRRCQSLMSKYGITEADLETSAFGHAEFTSGRTVPMHVKYLAAAVAELHDVVFVTGRGGFAEFRGYEVDANVARLTLDYLLDAVERALTARKRSGDFPAGRSAAYDYRMGFTTEVNRRVKELVAERRRAEQQAAGAGTALTVRKREIVDRECRQDLVTSTFRGRGARDAFARAAGTDDGARVSLEEQVGHTPGRTPLPRSR